VLEGLFPILVSIASHSFPPIFFTAISSLLASFVFFFLLVILRQLDLRSIQPRTWLHIFGVGMFIVVAYVLIFLGGQATSSINIALLLKMEMLFTFVFSTFFLRERLHSMQVVGGGAVFLGALAILFNGTLEINGGDLLIVAATALFPLGNTCAKRALKVIRAEMLLFLRYLIGGTILLILSVSLEDLSLGVSLFSGNELLFLLTYVGLILVGSKLFWYAGLKQLSLGKSVYIVSASTAFSLLFAFAVLREIPSWYQWMGFALTLGGIWLLISPKTLSRPMPDLV